RFIALSYVWGNANIFKTVSSNVSALQEPGALCNANFPINRVIEDAIEVSHPLQERYLWIDALCIVQDDEAHKANLIAQMDSIYARVFLTVIALSAENADSGLQCVWPGTRLANFVSLRVSDTESSPPTLPNGAVAVRPYLRDVLECGLYNKRGWTFQESCLSRRCLIFTDHGIFFHCDKGRESEVEMSTFFETLNNRLDSGLQYQPYTRLVYLSSKCKLMDSKDTLNELSGIFASFTGRYAWSFTAGKPSRLMDYALLWMPT
ncbi:heterokaryon incompatibility protein-domain-containing protein, partial [Dendryphion nanum]